MTWLSVLLIAKISMTAALVAVPFLFAPLAKLEAATRMNAKSALFYRLYGVAIAALLVGYGFGIPAAQSGRFPWGVASMGLVSNAGAAFLLLRASSRGSAGFRLGTLFALVAVALAVSLAAPVQALQKVW